MLLEGMPDMDHAGDIGFRFECSSFRVLSLCLEPSGWSKHTPEDAALWRGAAQPEWLRLGSAPAASKTCSVSRRPDPAASASGVSPGQQNRFELRRQKYTGA